MSTARRREMLHWLASIIPFLSSSDGSHVPDGSVERSVRTSTDAMSEDARGFVERTLAKDRTSGSSGIPAEL